MAAARALRRLRPVDDGHVPIVSYQNYAWRGYCHSCSRAVSSGGRGAGDGGSPARKPAHRATVGDFLAVECERLRVGESRQTSRTA